MKNIEKIIKAYDIRVMKNGFISVAKKGEANYKTILPSKKCRLYFMFGEEYNAATIQELVRKRKAIKLTAYDFYKLLFDDEDFEKSMEAYNRFRLKGEQAV